MDRMQVTFSIYFQFTFFAYLTACLKLYKTQIV